MKTSNIRIENVEPIETITTVSVFGCGIITSFIYWFASVFGIESRVMSQKLQNAINSATNKLIQKAEEINADGIMNIRYQMSFLSVMVYGTAYKETRETKEEIKNQLNECYKLLNKNRNELSNKQLELLINDFTTRKNVYSEQLEAGKYQAFFDCNSFNGVLVVKAEEKKIVLFEVSKAENHYIDFEITDNCIVYTLNAHINYII